MRLFIYLFLVLLSAHPSSASNYAQLGWPQTLGHLFQQLDAKPKNYFILISRVPTIPVDFRTVEGMHHSVNSLSFQNQFHPGHKMIGWKCKINGIPFNSMLALTGESNEQNRKMLTAGWGLTALLATFKDGFIQTPGELESRFKFFNDENERAVRSGKKKPIFLMAAVIEITEADCENVINESFEFLNHPNNPVENFSMILSPYNYEGAGCGSFAAHFMERIESLKTLIPIFRRQFQLPNFLFGTGIELPEDVEIPARISAIAVNRPVSKAKLVALPWISSLSPNLSVEILDPELVVFWQKLFFDVYFDRNHSTDKKRSFNKMVARGVWERIEDIYTPEQTRNKYVTIDKNFDARTKAIYDFQTRFVEDRILSYFTFSTFPGIILEKK